MPHEYKTHLAGIWPARVFCGIPASPNFPVTENISEITCEQCKRRLTAADASGGSVTGRFSSSEPEIQNLKLFRSAEEQRQIGKVRRLARSYHLGVPYGWRQSRRMMAEDICWFGHPHFDALVMMNLEHKNRDLYAELARSIFDDMPEWATPQCSCDRSNRPEGGHEKDCPLYLDPERYHKG